MDKMDSFKTSMPRVNTKTKKSGAKYFKQFVNGVLVHGQKFFAYLGHDAYGLRGWADLQIECLLRTIVSMDVDYEKRGKPLPPVLYLQLDNAKDNKNQYLFAFVEWIVNIGMLTYITFLKPYLQSILLYFFILGIVAKAEIAFLKVGHTHEDIDQRFSVLSKYLNIHDALTPSQWVSRCGEAFAAGGKRYQKLHNQEGPPEIEYVYSVYGYSEWLKPHIESEYSGTDGPSLIEFAKCPVRGRCVQRYKHLSSSGDWFPHGRFGEIGGDSAPQSELVADCGLDVNSAPRLRVLQLLSPVKLKIIFKSVMKFVRCKFYTVLLFFTLHAFRMLNTYRSLCFSRRCTS
jgi:hypothetical protein